MPERPRLEGKVAIVTGAGSSGPGIGNGKATSLLFAREGAKVLLVDATLERAEETQRMIREEGGEASVFQADMTNRGDCQAMADAAMERYGRLDILDNNVGMSMRGTVGPHHRGQREKHDFRQRRCDSLYERERRWIHHQYLIHRRAQGSFPDPLHHH